MIGRIAIFACWLLGASTLAFAASENDSDAFFARGVRAFNEGRYAAAVEHFSQARAAGLDKPALHYNLGAALFKLARYSEAEAAFMACTSDRTWRSLAYYNMGLAAHERGDRALAIQHFNEAARTADSDNVRALATTMLERLGAAPPPSAIRGEVAVDAGHNDNVTLSANNQTLQTTREADSFLQFYGKATGGFDLASNALLWDASLYNVSYNQLDDNDVTDVYLALSKPGKAGEWRTEIGIEGEYLWAGGESFQRTASLRLQARRPLTFERDLRVRLRLSAIDAVDKDFDFLTGSRQELDVSISEPFGNGRIRTGISLEQNDRLDLRTTNEFYSYSPTRYGVWVTGSWPIASDWRLEPSAIYDHSRYADPDRRAGGLVGTRKDKYLRLGLRAAFRVSTNWRLLSEYVYLQNNSNFSEFAYHQRVLSVGLSRLF